MKKGTLLRAKVIKLEKISKPDPKDPNNSVTKLIDIRELKEVRLTEEHITELNRQSNNSLLRYEVIKDEDVEPPKKALSQMNAAELDAKALELDVEFPEDVGTNKEKAAFLKDFIGK